ncbi:cyclic nucleotide-binding domain-containing protein [Paracoccus sp. MBLB3053]|uniref:Cyclic nucleotide-binding domain-containing protein n=1 Tax=Paracoccus aurantius TaxID=3073814 RepID=A0ABU2HYD9_9RHOB|nr:cyclic nucleotide-binding domain-containing protein [Paracoccus sp. MBLB3053]MDS9470084.1 cyclic nucleotide-binding domain-containing protein [Paracoccus sp. MBLB3053]
MLLEDEVALLRKLPLLSRVDPGRLKVLCFASDRESFAPGEVLFREGEASAGAYVILSGSVDVFKSVEDSHYTKTGSDAAVAIIGQSSMLNDTPRRATVTALTDVEVLRINSSCFMQLMTSCCKSSEGVIRSLGAQLGDADVAKKAMSSDR